MGWSFILLWDREMNIYLIERTDRIWYDEYSGHIVVSETEEKAREFVSRNSRWDEWWDIWKDDKTRCLIVWTTELYSYTTILLSDFNAW